MGHTVVPVRLKEVWEKSYTFVACGRKVSDTSPAAKVVLPTQGEEREIWLKNHLWLKEYCTGASDSGASSRSGGHSLNKDIEGENLAALLDDSGEILMFDESVEAVDSLEEKKL